MHQCHWRSAFHRKFWSMQFFSTPMLSLFAIALFRLKNILSKLYLPKVSFGNWVNLNWINLVSTWWFDEDKLVKLDDGRNCVLRAISRCLSNYPVFKRELESFLGELNWSEREVATNILCCKDKNQDLSPDSKRSFSEQIGWKISWTSIEVQKDYLKTKRISWNSD